MNYFTRIAAACLLGLLFLQPAAAADPLEQKALRALFPGSFQAQVHGYNVSFVAHRDGLLVGTSKKGTDTGQWSVQQGQLCIMLTSWLSGRTACSQVVRQGDWYRADNVVFRKL